MSTYSNAAGSSSTVTTEAVTGWHVLNISKYSETKGHYGVGRSFKSRYFTVGGHRWSIAYYADGYDDDDSDCICFDLVLQNPKPDAAPVKADFVFTLLDGAGEPVPEYTKAWECSFFSADVPSWGFQRFIERDELEESPYLVEDGFSVRCDVTVYKEDSKAEVAAAASLIHDEPEIAAVAPLPPPAAARRGLLSCWRLVLLFIVTLLAASWLEFKC